MTSGEGGIRTPFIVSGPNVQEGIVHHNFIYVTDIMPTLLDLAGVDHPDSFRGNEVLPMRGKSFSKVLSGEKETLYNDDEFVAGEMQNGKWIRKASFKAVFITAPYGPNEWELYNLDLDPGETTDLSESEPEMLQNFIEEWRKYAVEVGVVAME